MTRMLRAIGVVAALGLFLAGCSSGKTVSAGSQRCGDGVLDQASEACDDGNNTGGDGCAADCSQVETGFECFTPGAPCTALCADGGLWCNGVCCALGEICPYGDICLPDAGGCVTDGECQNDSYCDNAICVPYGAGPRGSTDPSCTRLIIAGLFQPALQCEWKVGAGDPYPNHTRVLGTPMVADFDFDNDPTTLRPSIVFLTYDADDGDGGVQTGSDGVMRIIDGATCSPQFSLGPFLDGSNPVAIGDLDNAADNRPEIVAHRNTGGAIAYKYDGATATWGTLWVGHNAAGAPVVLAEGATGWGGPSLVDLNDDGLPEILSGGYVYDSTGLLLDSHLSLTLVTFPVAADVDNDGKVELVNGNGVWRYNPDAAVHAWEAVWAGGVVSVFSALGDFGTYDADPAHDNRAVLDGVPEIAVVANGHAYVLTIGGRTVFDWPFPVGIGGGPPTVGDFDGDQRAEIAASGSDCMTVFDPDCMGTPTAATCPTLTTTGILWWQPSQDHSSNMTGSSLFDFEGDGKVEAIYADECFVRVYRGTDGTVLYSQWRSSCTWHENPIVADVDGDLSSELVVPSNQSCGTTPTTLGGRSYDTSPNSHPMDPLFIGLPCVDAVDCISNNCAQGYCRCVDDSQCGGGGFVCAPPPAAGLPASGNTCRAEWQGSINGIRVYRDSMDRWVGSRPIWNQHAYSITNVEDNGKILSTSAVRKNWRVPGLNSFRQNIQGNLDPTSSPDATTGVGTFDLNCESGGALMLHTRVCNRGTSPIGFGVRVGFYDGDPMAGGPLVCSAVTTQTLPPGACENLDCPWLDPPVGVPRDVTVVVDDNNQRSECYETNNRGMIRGAYCITSM